MIKIKICGENAQKINDIIKSAEGKATARTCDYTDVLNLSEKLEGRLNKYDVPKKYRAGASGSYCQLIGVKAYKKISYHASSTQIYIIRGSSDWFFTGADRVEIDPASSSSDYSFYPSPEAVECVKKRAEKEFRII